MRSILFGVLLACFLSPDAQAQVTPINFKLFDEAAVVLSTGGILTGTLRFYAEQDVISLRCSNDSVYTLPAKLVRGFAAKDDPTQLQTGDTYVAVQRIFLTFLLPASNKDVPPKWGFFEQLSREAGPVLLLRREQMMVCDVNLTESTAGAKGDPTTRPIPGPTASMPCGITTMLYLGTSAGSVVFLRKPQDVLKYFAKQAPQLRAYARENGLRYDNNRDLSFLVNYANALTGKL